MKLIRVSHWIVDKMNKGSQHKIDEVNSSYAIAQSANYKLKNLYSVKLNNTSRYMYEVECQDPESYRLVAFFKWMIYIIRKNDEVEYPVSLYFEYEVPSTFVVNKCGMSLVDCQQQTDDSFILKLYGEKMFGSSNDDKVEEISIGEKENVESEETEMTYICRNLISVVERQKEIIDELLKMKQEIGALKCHAVEMTPANKEQK